jgi:hypothetical protein
MMMVSKSLSEYICLMSKGVDIRDAGHRRSKMMSVRPAFMEPFPLKNDAGYIGYLTDDDDSESGGDASDVMMKVLNRRRRELIGSDISFSTCMFMMIAACGLLLLVIWGVRPPTAGGSAPSDGNFVR